MDCDETSAGLTGTSTLAGFGGYQETRSNCFLLDETLLRNLRKDT